MHIHTANQSGVSGLSDIIRISDRLAHAPDLIKKTAAAAGEFRRLQVLVCACVHFSVYVGVWEMFGVCTCVLVIVCVCTHAGA